MAGNVLLSHNRVVDELAEKYERHGYRVTIGPKQEELPAFLKGYQPDLIAEGPGESVVVEVKVGGEVRRADYWRDFAVTVGRQPGWRFELVVANGEQSANRESISLEEIQTLLNEGQELERRGMLGASLLVAWPAVEAALRLAAETQRVDVPDYLPQTLITRLYSDGALNEQEFRTLRQGLRIRNAVAHGFREEPVSSDLLRQLRAIVTRLVEGNEAAE